MFKSLNRAISPLTAITIITVGSVLVGGFMAWQYFGTSKEEEISEGIELEKNEYHRWKTYTSESLSIEIKYPEDWKIQEEPLNINFSKEYLTDSNKNKCNFQVSIVSPQLHDQMLELHKYAKADDWRKEQTILKGIPVTMISYPKFPIFAYYFLERDVLKESSVNEISEKAKIYYLISHDATKFELDDRDREIPVEEHFFVAQCMEIFDQMISTFRFLE